MEIGYPDHVKSEAWTCAGSQPAVQEISEISVDSVMEQLWTIFCFSHLADMRFPGLISQVYLLKKVSLTRE
jgi:hypothetical protein